MLRLPCKHYWFRFTLQSHYAMLNPIELQRAISQLADIHAQISRTEMYRGFRAAHVAVTGAIAFLAALLQPWLIPFDTPDVDVQFVLYWVCIATINVLATLGLLLYAYFFRETPLERQKSRHMLMQLAPSLIAGGMLTYLVVGHAEVILIQYLPGLWSLVFALGVFACRPYLPAATFWLGCYYLSAASLLLLYAPHSLQPWTMGCTFGVGQLLAAGILYRDIECQG